ncbi:MAG: OmpA family protein [Alphaproteobacteria bacterium]
MTAKSLAAAMALLATAACAGPDIDRLRATPLQGDVFDRTLAREYLKFATFEADQMDDWLDARHFARKGLKAAHGRTPAPERLDDWRLPKGRIAELAAARKRLVEILDAGARRNHGASAAIAQAGFDCWVEQQEEGFQSEDIAACRNRFFAALGKLEKTPGRKVAASGKPDTNAVLRESRYLVFFGHDAAIVGHKAAAVIAAAAEVAKQANTRMLVVAGHADRSGPERYNSALSLRRADAVRAALIRAGLRPGRISVAARGEAAPMVATKDGVREPRNRRAEIELR